jgi:recombinational DNA repair protein RecT
MPRTPKEKPPPKPVAQPEAQETRPAFEIHPLNIKLVSVLQKQADLPEARRAQIGASVRSALYALYSKGTLAKDVPISDLVNAVRISASLNLHIGTVGRAELWLLPRRTKEKINGVERVSNHLVTQIGVQGFIKLAARSHRLAAAYQVTHEDIATGRFVWDPLGQSSFTPNPVQYYLYGAEDIGKLAGFVVVTKGGNLPTMLRWVNMKELDRHKAYSAGRGWNPWDTNPEAMYRITALRIALKDEPFTFEGTDLNPFDEELRLEGLDIDDYDDAPPPEPDGAVTTVDERGVLIGEVLAGDVISPQPDEALSAPPEMTITLTPTPSLANGETWGRTAEQEHADLLSEEPQLVSAPVAEQEPPKRRGRPSRKSRETLTAD